MQPVRCGAYPAASAGSDGVGLPDRAARRERLCLRPHADWHWGAQARWHEWAPVGGLGLITWDRTLDGGQGTRRKIVSRLL